jgi:hypothetical protein
LSTENESAWLGAVEPKLKQSGIFIDRFFKKMPYEEIAAKYNTSLSSAISLYVNARDRLVKTAVAMDRCEIANVNGKPLVEMTNQVRVFLLHALFGLSNGEICRLLGLHHGVVGRYINRVKDRIIAGEINLVEYTDEERQAAKDRLKAAREYGKKLSRKSHRKRRAKGLLNRKV